MLKNILIIALILPLCLYAQTKIEWLTSNPGGATLNCFTVIDDSTFIAAGTNSIIAKSNDAGKSWIINGNFLNRIAEFRKVQFFNKNDGVILGDVKQLEDSKIYYTKDGGQNWTESQFPFNVHINDWLFLNEQYGIALGPYELYKTIDGGKSWIKEMLEVGYKFNTINKNGDGSLSISCERVISWGNRFTPKNIAGAVIISDDNGSTWKKLIEYKDKIVVETYFVDGQTGIICCYDGANNYIYKTNDRGKTYDEKKVLQSERIKDLYFPINDIGMLMLKKGILFSDNKGETWNIKYTDGSVLSSFYNYSNAIYTIGSAIRISHDNGYNWENITPRYKSFKSALQIIDQNNLISHYRLANTNGFSVMKTTDGGINWKDIWNYSTTEFQLVSFPGTLAFFTSQVGIIATNNKEILRTDDGGITWNRQAFFTELYLSNIKIYNEKIALIVASLNKPDNQNGAILYTIDGGKNWNRSNISSAHLLDVDYADKNTWYAVGYDGVFKSTDTGKSWTFNYKIDKSYLSSISFATKDTGYAVGASSNIIKTVDGGKSWSPVDFNLGPDIYYRDVNFWGNFGVIVGSNYIFISIDRGNSWTKEVLDTEMESISLYQNICYLSSYHLVARFSKEGYFPFGKIIESDPIESDPIDNNDTTKSDLITEFTLEQNYPNPFNGDTTLEFTIPNDTYCEMKIYNMLGQIVDAPLNGLKTKGRYKIHYRPSHLSSGVYFYEITSSNYHALKKMVYMK